MKKHIKIIQAFTLVEILVSITIFSIILISVTATYISSSNITLKSDINRIMQENLKNVSNTISEDIIANWISGVSFGSIDDCDFSLWSNLYKYGDKLCTKSWNHYYLAKKNPVNWDFVRVENSECSNLDDHCFIVKAIDKPLTNSYVSVKELNFYLSKDYIPKVTMNIVLHPSTNKWVRLDLIKSSNITFQTTITERPF